MLDKNDLKQICDIVQGSEKRLNTKIGSLDKKLDSTKKEIISTLSREVKDLADINRAVINKTEELDYRLRIVERKLGLNAR